MWPPWGRGRPLGPVWPPWGRGRPPGPRVDAVGAWPAPWAPCGRRGGVAGHPSPSMPHPSSSVCAGRASNLCGEEWKTWNCSRVHSLLCGFQVFTFCFEITEGVFIIFLYIICVRHTCTCLHEEPFSYIYSCLLAIQEHLYPFFQVIHLFSGNFCLQ